MQTDLRFDTNSVPKPKRKVPVLRMRTFAFIFSAVILLAGIVSWIITGGFNLGIDFESGLSERIGITRDGQDAVRIDEVRDALSSIDGVKVQTVGDENSGVFQIRLPANGGATQAELEALLSGLLADVFGKGNAVILESNYIGARFSSSLVTDSLIGIGAALVLILIYIWVRFRLAYALSAVVGLIHDVLLLLSFIMFLRIEISSTTIAAILTIIGYCLNNTIVIFDRMRENVLLNKEVRGNENFESIMERSVAQSLTRTLLSSLTTILAVTPLAIFSTGDVRLFAICLIIGIAIGAYSSNFISPNIINLIGKIGNPAFDPMNIPEKKKEDEERPEAIV